MNVALQFQAVRERDCAMDVGDRVQNIAELVANQPDPGRRHTMIGRLRKKHPAPVVDDIIERAKTIYYRRRRRRA